MLPTTSEISWTRSGLAYFIVLRKRSDACAYERIRAALKWNQAQYTWPNRRFQWKYFIANTWSLPAFFVTVASGFEIWISETAVQTYYWFVHKILSTENYSYPPSSGEETIAMVPVLGICCPQNCELPPSHSAPFAFGAAKTNKLSNLSVNSLPMQWSAIMSPVPSD